MSVLATMATKLRRGIATVSVTLIALTVTLAGLFTAEATTSRPPSPATVAAQAATQPTPQAVSQLIKAKHSGKCLHVAGVSPGNGVAIVQWKCNDPQPPVQRWDIDSTSGGHVQIRSRFGNKCLDLAYAGTENAVAVVQNSCDRRPSQQWTANPVGEGYYQFINSASTRCLHVSGPSIEDSAAIIQYDCDLEKANQLFTFDS